MQDHLCISTRTNQLLRWQQAFPGGKVVASVMEAGLFVSEAKILWLHADALPGQSLLTALAELRRSSDCPPVIIVSCMPHPAEAVGVFKLGASGYCHAMAAPALLQQVALVVQNGGLWIGPDLMHVLIDVLAPASTLPGPEAPGSVLHDLSPREQEVASQVGRGASNKEIAHTLAITERTVKAHLGSIFEKIGIRDRLQLALLLAQDDSEEALKISV